MAQKEGIDRLIDKDGKIISWPKVEADKQLVMEYLASKFEEGRVYKEREVNEVIMSFHDFMNPTMLRRELIGRKLMLRKDDCTAYWKERHGEGC